MYTMYVCLINRSISGCMSAPSVCFGLMLAEGEEGAAVYNILTSNTHVTLYLSLQKTLLLHPLSAPPLFALPPFIWPLCCLDLNGSAVILCGTLHMRDSVKRNAGKTTCGPHREHKHWLKKKNFEVTKSALQTGLDTLWKTAVLIYAHKVYL